VGSGRQTIAGQELVGQPAKAIRPPSRSSSRWCMGRDVEVEFCQGGSRGPRREGTGERGVIGDREHPHVWCPCGHGRKAPSSPITVSLGVSCPASPRTLRTRGTVSSLLTAGILFLCALRRDNLQRLSISPTARRHSRERFLPDQPSPQILQHRRNVRWHPDFSFSNRESEDPNPLRCASRLSPFSYRSGGPSPGTADARRAIQRRCTRFAQAPPVRCLLSYPPVFFPISCFGTTAPSRGYRFLAS
jgi:hypothetical protein